MGFLHTLFVLTVFIAKVSIQQVIYRKVVHFICKDISKKFNKVKNRITFYNSPIKIFKSFQTEQPSLPLKNWLFIKFDNFLNIVQAIRCNFVKYPFTNKNTTMKLSTLKSWLVQLLLPW